MDMNEDLRLISRSPNQTAALGYSLGRVLKPGDIICLEGDLGAGKTCLARGIARGLGVDEAVVSSPTFVLAQDSPPLVLSSSPYWHHFPQPGRFLNGIMICLGDTKQYVTRHHSMNTNFKRSNIAGQTMQEHS
jgi:hypothetical protein